MTSKEQTITVHVVAYRKAPGLHIQLAVTPEVLDLTQYDNAPLTIQWKLDTRGYSFVTDGSAIVFTSPGAKKSFGEVKVDREGRLATVKNKNADGLAYAYNVSVKEVATGLTAVLDPIVQNQHR
ncbi:hypothetical protein [Piscinibacter sp. HJYY11]|uniref:hypothetical protein n=1 Tax=Piscinibacter sp. HJYY11 TaxID=2801333 RepID=UPI00191DE4B5|nr:hypothetical protein [Piscinibacter sp. HJYY11]MBL0727545.1 hypothetical protein [Piscinibacter sp. HJYY11]